MNKMYLVAILALSCSVLPARSMATRPAAMVEAVWRGDTLVYQSAGWELHIDYLQRGTRSEGQHGRLLHKGKKIQPEADKEVRPTPFGDLKHYGVERKTLWAVSGWNFADRARIRPSEMVPHPKEGESEVEKQKKGTPVDASLKNPREGGRLSVNTVEVLP